MLGPAWSLKCLSMRSIWLKWASTACSAKKNSWLSARQTTSRTTKKDLWMLQITCRNPCRLWTCRDKFQWIKQECKRCRVFNTLNLLGVSCWCKGQIQYRILTTPRLILYRRLNLASMTMKQPCLMNKSTSVRSCSSNRTRYLSLTVWITQGVE